MDTLCRIKKGFTLVEIIVTLVVVMTLSALAIPRLGSVLEKFRAQEGKQILYSAMGAAMRFRADHGRCPTALSDLDITVRTTTNFDTAGITVNSTGSGFSCQPTISISRANGPVYTLTMSAGTQQVTCGSGTCPAL